VTSPPLRVGFDLSHVAVKPLTGVGVFGRNLIAALARTRKDIECKVVAMGMRPVREQLDPIAEAGASVRMYRIPHRVRIGAWTRFNAPPLEWFTGPIDIAFGGFHLAPPARKAARVAFIYDVAWRRFPGINTDATLAEAERIMAHSVRTADAFIAISECTRNDLIELYGIEPGRVLVAPGGIDLADFERPFDEADRQAFRERLGITRPYFAYIGNLEPRKNLPRLIEAYGRLRAKRTDVPDLVLAGPPAWLYEPVYEAIQQSGAREHIVLTGFLTHADALLLLREAVACTYVSLYEGFGLPALEAMAAGTPLLTSNVSSLPEVTGDTALTIDPYTVESIEAGLAALLDDPDAARERAERALVRARTMTWDAAAGTLAEALHTVHRARA